MPLLGNAASTSLHTRCELAFDYQGCQQIACFASQTNDVARPTPSASLKCCRARLGSGFVDQSLGDHRIVCPCAMTRHM